MPRSNGLRLQSQRHEPRTAPTSRRHIQRREAQQIGRAGRSEKTSKPLFLPRPLSESAPSSSHLGSARSSAAQRLRASAEDFDGQLSDLA